MFSKYHSSWGSFFTQKRQLELFNIMSNVAKDKPTPSLDSALRFLEVDLNCVQFIILGMDPYPQKGRATGRAFEDGNLLSWAQLKYNPSLSNILKLIYKNKSNKGLLPISRVRSELAKNPIILPPNKLFNSWESQGVLLLNVALTCKIGKSGSHLKQWEPFTKSCFTHIAKVQPNAQWLLWGKDAQNAAPSDITSLISQHPRLHRQAPKSFLAENHFSKYQSINWAGT